VWHIVSPRDSSFIYKFLTENTLTTSHRQLMNHLAVLLSNVQLCKLLLQQKKADQLSEQRKFGVYYDDDYDYLQHLKDVNELNDVGIVEHFRISADQV